MATSFAVYNFSTAFACYYIDQQTNTITPLPGRNTKHILRLSPIHKGQPYLTIYLSVTYLEYNKYPVNTT